MATADTEPRHPLAELARGCLGSDFTKLADASQLVYWSAQSPQAFPERAHVTQPLTLLTHGRPQDDTVPEPARIRIWRAIPSLHGGDSWSSFPAKDNEKFPRIPRYKPVPEPDTTGTLAVTLT